NEFVHHSINYFEIYATDLTEAKRFFGQAFGWQFNEYGPDYLGIRKLDDEDLEYGGICRVDQVNPGGSLIVLYSNDLDQSQASVENAGGKISKEIFSFPGGRRFQFIDPSGNEMAVWSDIESTD
ncbi:MAG: VOC family protein, partial [Planctomycetota bacterium]